MIQTEKAKSKKPEIALILFLFAAIIILGRFMRFAHLRFYRAAYPVHYLDTVLAQSDRNRLDPGLVFAVIRCESGFNELAVSHVEARGLMQITLETFEWARWRMGEDESVPFDEMFTPEANIRYGTAILRLLLDEFGSEPVALAAYHAGWGSVKRWLADERYSADGASLSSIPYANTDSYVSKVIETQKAYRSLYEFE